MDHFILHKKQMFKTLESIKQIRIVKQFTNRCSKTIVYI